MLQLDDHSANKLENIFFADFLFYLTKMRFLSWKDNSKQWVVIILTRT